MTDHRFFIILLALGCFKGVESTLCFGCFELSPTSEKSSENQVHGEKLKKEFDEINQILSSKENEDAEEDLKEVEKILKDLESDKPIMGGADKRVKQIKAARLLLSLRRLKEENLGCNRHGLEIVRQIQAATNQRRALIRIKSILDTFIKQQEQVCLPYFSAHLKDVLDRMDTDIVSRIAYLAKEAFGYQSEGSHLKPNKVYTAIKLLEVGPTEESLNIALQNFPQVLPKDIKKNLTFKGAQKEVRKATLEYHLIEPCKYYRERVGPDMFDLASLWIPFHSVDSKYNQFYHAWLRYQLCKSALKSDFVRETFSKDIK